MSVFKKFFENPSYPEVMEKVLNETRVFDLFNE